MTSPALDLITVKGFRSIASIDKLALRPINVLIGANGSGKSNFVGVFSFLHEIREGRLQDYVRKAGGAEQLLHFGSKVSRQIVFDISFAQRKNEYYLRLRPTDDDRLYPAFEQVEYWEKDEYTHPKAESLAPRDSGREAGISGSKLIRIPGWLRVRLGSWRVYRL